jgi:hypothetical protein
LHESPTVAFFFGLRLRKAQPGYSSSATPDRSKIAIARRSSRRPRCQRTRGDTAIKERHHLGISSRVDLIDWGDVVCLAASGRYRFMYGVPTKPVVAMSASLKRSSGEQNRSRDDRTV